MRPYEKTRSTGEVRRPPIRIRVGWLSLTMELSRRGVRLTRLNRREQRFFEQRQEWALFRAYVSQATGPRRPSGRGV